MNERTERFTADWLVPLAMIFPTLGAWIYFVKLDGSRAAGIAYLVSKALQLAIPLIWIAWTGKRPGRLLERSGVRAGLLNGVLLSVPIFVAYYGFVAGTPLQQLATERIQGKLADFHIGGPLSYLAMALAISVAHSFFEEFYFRWFVYGRTRAYMARSVAAVVASAAFASHHVIVLARYVPAEKFWSHAVPASVGVAIGGLVWCALLERKGGLTAPWISHLLVDAALMTVGALMIFG